MKKTTLLALAAFALLTVAGCGDPEPAAESGGAEELSGKLVITGSSTVAPLVSEIGKRFEKTHPQVRINVQTGGSSRGVADARRGTADIGMASRALKASESDLISHTIAYDGICIILNTENPVGELTEQQIVDIYTGKVENWSRVGGKDASITVVNKSQGRSTLELFLEHFGLGAAQVEADVIIGDNEQGIKTVAGNPNAIGYVSVGAAEYSAENGVPIKLLSLDSVKANIENVANGSFPLNRPLNLVTKEPPQGLSKSFIDYARSPAVHDLVKELYFVPI